MGFTIPCFDIGRVCELCEIPISDSELKAFKLDAKWMVVCAGDSLYVVVESICSGGGKSFLGTTRFPQGGGGKRVEVRIGT